MMVVVVEDGQGRGLKLKEGDYGFRPSLFPALVFDFSRPQPVKGLWRLASKHHQHMGIGGCSLLAESHMLPSSSSSRSPWLPQASTP